MEDNQTEEQTAFAEWWTALGRDACFPRAVRDYSDINGNGYGSQHRWRATGQWKGCTAYKCNLCDAKFSHAYDETPNIFTAMKEEGVPEFCDPLWPIVSAHVTWTYLKDGARATNATTLSVMRRTAPSIDAWMQECIEWWEGYEKKGEAPDDLQFDICVRFDTWKGGWFTHTTFDVGLTDEEVLASFERFVRAKEEFNRTHYTTHRTADGHTFTTGDYCLMGAEDRYRWSGAKDGASGIFGAIERTDPPCRCWGCRKNGVVAISH